MNALTGILTVIEPFVPTRKSFDAFIRRTGWTNVYWDADNMIAVLYRKGIGQLDHESIISINGDEISLTGDFHTDIVTQEILDQREREAAEANAESEDKRSFGERLGAGFAMMNASENDG